MTTTSSQVVERAKGAFLNAKHGLLRALETTPDDRLNWRPSETARSPLHVAGHAAFAIDSMLGNMTGNTFPLETTDLAETYFRDLEQAFTSRGQVTELLESNSKKYLDWLDQLDDPQLESMFVLPFGMGSAKTADGLDFMALHLMWHTAQIQYIQTIYGDLKTHF
jgi:uncharacterized damage-inducible protein DinB